MLAFEPTFVEVRHVESGALMQIIPGNSLRCLFADTPPSGSSSSLAGSYFPHQYGGGGGYGHPPGGQPRYPPPGSPRNEIIIADSDRVFSRQSFFLSFLLGVLDLPRILFPAPSTIFCVGFLSPYPDDRCRSER